MLFMISSCLEYRLKSSGNILPSCSRSQLGYCMNVCVCVCVKKHGVYVYVREMVHVCGVGVGGGGYLITELHE